MSIPQEIAANVVDPKAYAGETAVQNALTWLRREMPVGLAEVEGYDPFWVVTKHADILTVERQNDLFHNSDRATTLTTRDADAKVRALTGGSPNLVYSLVQMVAKACGARAQSWLTAAGAALLWSILRRRAGNAAA